MTNQDRMTAMEDRGGGGWDWISALCVAAVILGALILGFNAFKMTTAELPTVTEAGSNPRIRLSVAALPGRRLARIPEFESSVSVRLE
jgi:hypothetical protein